MTEQARRSGWYRTLHGQMVHRLSAAKARAIKANLAFDLALPFLEALWEKQQGLCAVSGLPIDPTSAGTSKQRNPMGLSIDRRDNSQGYTQGNVQLTLFAVNQAKGVWSTECYVEAMLTYLRHQGYCLEKAGV